MTLTAQQQRDITAQEFWVDDGFAPIDTRGFPNLQPTPEDKTDDRFSRDYRDTALSSSAAALRRFVTDPDIEALTQVGDETGNPGLLRDLRDRRGERVVMEFKQRCPEYLPTDHNYRALLTTLAFNALPLSDQDADVDELVDKLIESGHWTAGNLEACYLALVREGVLDRPAGEARELREAERLEVARLAQIGRVDDAIEKYLEYALGEKPDTGMLLDPDCRDACDKAVFFVFQAATPDFSHSPERSAFIKRYCGSRPLNMLLLAHAWSACKKQEETYTRNELIGVIQKPEEETPTEDDLDSLDDRQLDSLYHSTLYARNAQRRPGVLA